MCKNIKFVECDVMDEGDRDDGECFNIRCKNGQPMIETVYFGDLALECEIDSGAAVTAVSKKYI